MNASELTVYEFLRALAKISARPNDPAHKGTSTPFERYLRSILISVKWRCDAI
jgi:hypothetical protein